MNTTAIIPAAGSGVRMQAGNRAASKLFLMLGSLPVLAHTLTAFDNAENIDEIIIAAREEDFLLIWDMISEFNIGKVSKIINGGAERADSVRAALAEVADDTDLIAIHDGARPLIEPELIDFAVLEAARRGAVTLGVPVKDTVKRANASGVISETLERNGLYHIQTPQIFRADIIREAYGVGDAPFQTTDDCELVERLGVPVHIIGGDYANIKITTAEDLLIAEGLLCE